MLQKSTYSKDCIWTRTDIILKADDTDDYITVKAWDLNCGLKLRHSRDDTAWTADYTVLRNNHQVQRYS